MTTYALIVDGLAVEIIEPMFYETDQRDAEGELLHAAGAEIPIGERYHPDFVTQLVECAPGAKPDEPRAAAPTEDDVRASRVARLNASDWTQLGDVPQATREAWAGYRQALRDVPSQSGFPADVKWPEPPQ